MIKNEGSLGSLRTTKPLTIPPKGQMIIKGHTHIKAACTRLTVCLDDSSATSLPRGVVMSPSVGYLEPGSSTSKLSVEVVNHLQQAVTILAKARICDLYSTDDVITLDQQGTGLPENALKDGNSAFLDNFEQLKETLSEEQAEEVLNVLRRWLTVFSQHDLDLSLTDQAVHHIRSKMTPPSRKSPDRYLQ